MLFFDRGRSRPTSMLRFLRAVTCVLVSIIAVPAWAQVPGWNSRQFRIEQIDANHWRFTGQAELEDATGTQKFFADVVDLYVTEHRLEASGNVVYQTKDARVAADRAVFDTETQTGTFYEAFGMASLGERAVKTKSMFGTLEPDVYFYGRTLTKVGQDRYRIERGGFTTCVQPAPRWEVVVASATINVGDYAILKGAVMRVKEVPIFYFPVLYYPIQDDDRATGFLLPTYGRSSYRGQSISNAFFWAISRSHDLTLFHDWFTSRGQGAGAEFRYVASPTANGNLRAYLLDQKAGTVGNFPIPARRAYEIGGGLTQDLPLGLKARARIDYFSDITLQQLYNNNIYEASRRSRTIGGSVAGSYSGVSVSATFQRNELFLTDSSSLVNGSAPGFSASVSSRRLSRLPLFFAFQGDAGRPVYITRNGDSEVDQTMSRIEMLPSLRAPLINLPFLSVTGTAAYRYTRYGQSLDATGAQVPVPLTRAYFDLKADVIGPTFSRVFSPNNVVADRLKHVIEPSLSVQRITRNDVQDRVVLLGSAFDYVVGNTTRMSYALTNRVLVRKAPRPLPGEAAPAPTASAPRELLTLGVSQTFYSDPLASRYDFAFASSFGFREPSRFSPVAVQLRSALSSTVGANSRVEYDVQASQLRMFSAGADVKVRESQIGAAWSRRIYSESFQDNTLNGNARLKLFDGRIDGMYSLNWDIFRKSIVQQRLVASYNVQCCGIGVEFQQFNFAGQGFYSALPADRRFNITFTLAGIGTFSNFFGNMGGSGMGSGR